MRLHHLFVRALALLLLILLIALVACGGNDTNVVPATPAENSAQSTAAPAANSPAPEATDTPVTPAPTEAPAPNITPIAARTDCPLTGLPLNGVNLTDRRPLIIKLGNSSPERPQSGLDKADVIFEHLTEGAITRFSAVYYCSDAADIGPIRSARLIDLELVPMLDAIFAHVGGSAPVRQLIADSEVAKTDLDDFGRKPIFREIDSRKRPFNRYSSTQELWDLARKNGWLPGRGIAGFNYSPAAPQGGKKVGMITVPYNANSSNVVFTFDPSSGLYKRATGTTPDVDADSGAQLTGANVVVLFAPHETTEIIEDSLGSHSVRITLTGSGKAQAFRDGLAYNLTWQRTDPHSLVQLVNANGQPYALRPGNTWFEVVPPTMQIATQ